MKKMILFVLVLGLTAIYLSFSCSKNDDDDNAGQPGSDDDISADDDSGSDDDASDDDIAGFSLSSSSFSDNGWIPAKYTCDAENPANGISPPLSWSGTPEGTAAFALFLTDPDANDTPHWGLVDIPADATDLEQGISPNGNIMTGAWETLNYLNEVGYAGPCPPKGDSPHHYTFVLYAIDELIDKPEHPAKLHDIESIVILHSLNQAELIGLYKR